MKRARSCTCLLLVLTALAVAGCGEDAGAGRTPEGVYLLDRSDYARALVEANPSGSVGPAASADQQAAALAVRRAARKAAAGVDLRLDLAADGTFLVTWQFPGERGRRRGAWTQDGETLTLRITHDPAGVVKRGALVTATQGPEGIRFSGWPVPNAFLLRRK